MAGSYHTIFQALGSYDVNTQKYTAGSLAANVTSTTFTSVGMMPTASAQVWVDAGTPTGTFYIDVSNDKRAGDPQYAASANWVTVESVVYTAGVDPNGNPSSFITWLNGARWARARWVLSSGGTNATGGIMCCGTSV